MTRADQITCMVLFVLLSSLYFATASGITCSNDGSHYALTRALAEEARFTIDSYDQYAEGNDIAVKDEKLFSDRPPGTALISSVAYKIGGLLPKPLAPLPSRHDPQNPRLLYVLLVPVWAGAGAAVLLYRLLREFGISVFSALTTSVVLGVGTTHWKYSSVLFSHAPSAFLILLALYLVIRPGRDARPSTVLALSTGFVVGCAVLVEYSNALLGTGVGLYALLSLRSSSSRLRWVGEFVAGGLGPAGFLALYNTVNFGSPFALSYQYAVNYPWAGDLAKTFSFPLHQGLRAMLFWGEGGGWCGGACFNQGFLLLSPVLVLSVLGVLPYVRRAQRESLLILGILVSYLALFSTHRTFHGFTADGRYLVPFLALWCIPLAFLLEKGVAWSDRPAWQAGAYLVFYGGLFLSARNVFLHIGLSYNYTLDLGRLDSLIVKPANIIYLLGQVFRNARNLPLLWLCDGLLLLTVEGLPRVSRHWTAR
ncbi:MAG: hypothetical protein ACOC8C_01800 [Chloroflexota bacterium]